MAYGLRKNQGNKSLHNRHKLCKYLGVTLIKQVKDLYNKNSKYLKKEIGGRWD